MFRYANAGSKPRLWKFKLGERNMKNIIMFRLLRIIPVIALFSLIIVYNSPSAAQDKETSHLRLQFVGTAFTGEGLPVDVRGVVDVTNRILKPNVGKMTGRFRTTIAIARMRGVGSDSSRWIGFGVEVYPRYGPVPNPEEVHFLPVELISLSKEGPITSKMSIRLLLVTDRFDRLINGVARMGRFIGPPDSK